MSNGKPLSLTPSGSAIRSRDEPLARPPPSAIEEWLKALSNKSATKAAAK